MHSAYCQNLIDDGTTRSSPPSPYWNRHPFRGACHALAPSSDACRRERPSVPVPCAEQVNFRPPTICTRSILRYAPLMTSACPCPLTRVMAPRARRGPAATPGFKLFANMNFAVEIIALELFESSAGRRGWSHWKVPCAQLKNRAGPGPAGASAAGGLSGGPGQSRASRARPTGGMRLRLRLGQGCCQFRSSRTRLILAAVPSGTAQGDSDRDS